MGKNKTLKRYRKANKIAFFPYYFGKTKNVFLYALAYIKNLFNGENLMLSTGTHIITGYPGSGKTLLMNKIINMVDSDKYFFYTNIDEFSSNNVYKIDINMLFDDKKQQFKLKTWIGKRKLYGIILDEINLNFNKRINQTKDYTNVFIGLVEMIVTHRHQNIPRVYFIGQKLELQDTQLISLFKYQHDIVKTKKRYRYWKYYKDYLQRVPVKLGIMHRMKSIEDNFIDFRKQKIKISWHDLESYDTLALRKNYENLKDYPIDKVNK